MNPMKHLSLFLMALLFAATTVTAQGGPEGGPERLERVEAMKVAFMTDKLALTPEEAQKFWPVYNQYERERRALHHEYRIGPGPQRAQPANLTEAEADELINRELEFRQKELELTRSYTSEFRKVLPLSKVAALPQVEEQFRKMIIERIREGQQPGPGPKR